MNTINKTAWVTLEQAAEHVGPRRAGRPTQPNTIRAWCLVGLAGVKMRSRMRGGVRMTKLREVDRFFRRFWDATEAGGSGSWFLSFFGTSGSKDDAPAAPGRMREWESGSGWWRGD